MKTEASYLYPKGSVKGRWMLDEDELTSGEVIEVQPYQSDEWVRVRVEFNQDRGEYWLIADNRLTFVMSHYAARRVDNSPRLIL